MRFSKLNKVNIRAGRFVVDIEYAFGNERREQRINFTETRQRPFGGIRKWFQCPGCKRRCDVLYLSYSILCRKCLGLDYQSERTLKWRPYRRMERIRKLMKAPAPSNTHAPCPERPLWGNYRIYERRKAEYEEALNLQHQTRLPPDRGRWR